ncbi:hypothetical protein Clacol_004242 [Clathrus columnatus]|uniref:Helitron helicase-like domain-containing protein n=1 Tax=Clathrus columnatus TaxID=1419009 RepID=A0AAV5AAH1_9AGAM|nr:hypothetical protein Clacol_004242 [Clathrus columnatus]
MYLGLPTIWLTINPSDLHDPIAQVFVGEKINMDEFMSTIGPNALERAKNIAADPYAATKFFYFLVDTIFETIIRIKVVGHRVKSQPGIFGEASAYFGTVESQGQGTLHLHTIIWLKNTPSSEKIHEMLQTICFRDKVCQFIKANFHAYLPGLENKESINSIPRDKEITYNRPIDPQVDEYETKVRDFEIKLASMEQIHTCHPKRCLNLNKQGQLECKRRAPFLCSEYNFITEKGEWGPNGEETKNITFYVTSYAAKKQGKNFNMSAILAKGFTYHTDQEWMGYVEQLRDAQKLLLFQLLNAINREQELSASMVVSYIMGWGDVKIDKLTPTLIINDTSFNSTHIETSEQQRGEDVTEHDTVNDSEVMTGEMMTLQVTPEGNLFCIDQVTDYQYRGHELENYSVLDFFVDTYEGIGSTKSKNNNMVVVEDTIGEDRPLRGRPQNERIRYMDAHPKANDKCRVLRSKSHRNLPNLVGSHLPRKDDASLHEFYCASVMVLLKPWRNINNIKESNQTWQQSFEKWLVDSPDLDRCRFILSGIQYYHECQTSANEHQNKDNVVYDDHSPDEEHGLFADVFDDAVKMQDKQTSWNVISPIGVTRGSESIFHLLKKWKDQMKRDVLLQNSNMIIHSTGETIHVRDSWDLNIPPSVWPCDGYGEMESHTEREQFPTAKEALSPLAPSLLNTDQFCAFDIITRHLEETLSGKNPPQLCMIIHGEGGTGKSKVIQSVTEAFVERGAESLLVKAAYTGVVV